MPAGRCWSWRSLIMLLLWLYYSSQILFSERELALCLCDSIRIARGPSQQCSRACCAEACIGMRLEAVRKLGKRHEGCLEKGCYK